MNLRQMLDELLVDMKREFPSFKVVNKEDSRFQRALAWLVRPFNPDFMTSYATTFGDTVYVPKAWGSYARYEVLRHERIHLRDHRTAPFGLFALSYLLCLPVGITMRAWWEYRAYTETMRVEHELFGIISDATIERLVGVFTGPSYLFMCPFKGYVRRKLEQTRADILAGKV
jgi:hypothetical protein